MLRRNSILILVLCAAMLHVYGCGGIMKANHLIGQEKYDEAIPILKKQITDVRILSGQETSWDLLI